MIGLLILAAINPLSVIYVEQAPANVKSTAVLFLEADGVYLSWAGTVRKRPGGHLELDTDRSYQTFCGRWRRNGPGNIKVRQRVGESFGPIVPLALMRWHDRDFSGSVGAANSLPLVLVNGSRRFQQTAALSRLSTHTAALRLQCRPILSAP